MNILFLGDIMGRPGRRAVATELPRVLREFPVDFVVANAENAAGGKGATPEILQDLRRLGVQGFTMGNHTWKKKTIIPAMDAIPGLVRPANYPPGAPGRGSTVLALPDGRKLGVLNLIGRVYMEAFDCPFRVANEEIARLREETHTILVDMHAEATSEKVAMGWHLDGRCSAVVGTHTHVQTADEWVLPQGTAFITDVGMCGPSHSVIGTEVSTIVNKFLNGMPKEYEVAKGPAQFCAVLVETDDATGLARGIRRFFRREDGPGEQ